LTGSQLVGCYVGRLVILASYQHIPHMCSTAACLGRAHVEFCKSLGQTPDHIKFQRHANCIR